MTLTLSSAIQTLKQLAPLEHAEAWDNVGLLVEPAAREGQPADVSRTLLTIDLTDTVLEEAVALECELIVAYHPPVFRGIKRLVNADPLSRRIIELVERGIAVYSPHTALDAARGGVNDWLIDAFGPGVDLPIVQAVGNGELKVVVFVPEDAVDALRLALANAGAGQIGEYSQCSFGLNGIGTFFGGAGSNPVIGEAGRLEKAPEIRLEMVCPPGSLREVAATIARVHPYEEPAWDAYALQRTPLAGVGMGRVRELESGLHISEAIRRVKQHLGLKHLRVAASARHQDGTEIVRVAACAGAGGTVLEGAENADLILSGELRHHDILAWVNRGTSVIVCDHTNTERGYLPTLAARLAAEWGTDVEVLVSKLDADPLAVL